MLHMHKTPFINLGTAIGSCIGVDSYVGLYRSIVLCRKKTDMLHRRNETVDVPTKQKHDPQRQRSLCYLLVKLEKRWSSLADELEVMAGRGDYCGGVIYLNTDPGNADVHRHQI